MPPKPSNSIAQVDGSGTPDPVAPALIRQILEAGIASALALAGIKTKTL